MESTSGLEFTTVNFDIVQTYLLRLSLCQLGHNGTGFKHFSVNCSTMDNCGVLRHYLCIGRMGQVSRFIQVCQ